MLLRYPHQTLYSLFGGFDLIGSVSFVWCWLVHLQSLVVFFGAFCPLKLWDEKLVGLLAFSRPVAVVELVSD
jgi:hypothetical protein